MTDLSLFYFFNDFAFRSTVLDALILFSAVFFLYWMILGVLAFAGAAMFPRYSHTHKKNIEIAAVSLASALVARFGITELIRLFYSRPRPFESLADVHQLLFREGGGSFPSGHAVFSFAIAAVVGRYYPKTGIAFYAAAILISISRVVAGVHWPSDILGGAVIGVGTGLLAYVVAKRFLPR